MLIYRMRAVVGIPYGCGGKFRHSLRPHSSYSFQLYRMLTFPFVINQFLNIGGVEHIANTVHAATDILNHGVEAAKGITVDRGTR